MWGTKKFGQGECVAAPIGATSWAVEGIPGLQLGSGKSSANKLIADHAKVETVLYQH